MAGLDPAIHVFSVGRRKDVDARQRAGHDVVVQVIARSESEEAIQCETGLLR
jgi:hypothetical protein